MKKLLVAGLAIGLGCAGTVDPVVAASLDVNFTPGTVLEVSQVTDYMVLSSCSRFGRVELLISSHPAQAGLFSTRPGENPA